MITVKKQVLIITSIDHYKNNGISISIASEGLPLKLPPLVSCGTEVEVEVDVGTGCEGAHSVMATATATATSIALVVEDTVGIVVIPRVRRGRAVEINKYEA